jgi:hypothetical protein
MSITATAVIGLLVLLSQSSSVEEVEPLYSTADDPDPLALVCLNHNDLKRHDHVTLNIFIDGEQEMIPSETGINSGVCNEQGENMHAVHTHTGQTLHIELNEAGDVPLGVFFDIWGVHFDETGIFDHRVNDTHEMRMYVIASGEVASEENRVTSFDEYLLQNGETIEIHYQAR